MNKMQFLGLGLKKTTVSNGDRQGVFRGQETQQPNGTKIFSSKILLIMSYYFSSQRSSMNHTATDNSSHITHLAAPIAPARVDRSCAWGELVKELGCARYDASIRLRSFLGRRITTLTAGDCSYDRLEAVTLQPADFSWLRLKFRSRSWMVTSLDRISLTAADFPGATPNNVSRRWAMSHFDRMTLLPTDLSCLSSAKVLAPSLIDRIDADGLRLPATVVAPRPLSVAIYDRDKTKKTNAQTHAILIQDACVPVQVARLLQGLIPSRWTLPRRQVVMRSDLRCLPPGKR